MLLRHARALTGLSVITVVRAGRLRGPRDGRRRRSRLGRGSGDGRCGIGRGGTQPYCNRGKRTAPPCGNQQMPPAGTFCCGNSFCPNSQLRCSVQQGGPSSPYPGCYAPEPQGTCPVGCPACQ